jgi:two-component system, OmpR family, response regulator AdeR
MRDWVARALVAYEGTPMLVTADLQRLSQLRAANPSRWIIALSTPRAQVAAAFDAGADIVLSGPPRPAELRARVRALQRRALAPTRVGPLELDPRARLAALDGVPLTLPRGELAVLSCLATAPGRVFSRAELGARVWGHTAQPPARRSLDRQVARLRRRLGRHRGMLVTVWGVGYRLDALT